MLNFSIRTKSLLRVARILSQWPSDIPTIGNSTGTVELFSSVVRVIGDAEKNELILLLSNLVYFGTVIVIKGDDENNLEVKESGQVSVLIKNLQNALANEDAATIKVKENQDSLGIKTKHGTLHLNLYYMKFDGYQKSLDGRDQCNKEGFVFELGHEPMRKIISQITYACAKKNQYRPILEAVNFHIEPKKEKQFLMRCAATDSYRMAIREDLIKVKGYTEEKAYSKNVPAKTLMPIGKMLAYAEDKKVPTVIHCTSDLMMFSFDAEENCHVDVVSNLVSGRYPDVRNVIPPRFTTKVDVDRDTLFHVLDRISMMKTNGISVCKFEISKNAFVVTSFVPEIGSTEEKIKKYNIKGDAVTASFNTKYLMDILKSMEGDTMSLYLNGGHAPMQLIDDQKDCVLDLIVPLSETR